jgi:hypothetical protein
MRWALLVGDVAFAVLGILMLLYGYRLIGKRPGVDERYDAAMARQGWMYKASGWSLVGMAVIGLIGYLTDSPW